MTQLESTLHRLIYMMAQHFDPNHPLKFAKLVIEDGGRMAVSNGMCSIFVMCYLALLNHLRSTTPEQRSLIVSRWAGAKFHPLSLCRIYIYP